MSTDTTVSLPTVPSTIIVNVNGADCAVPGKPNKAETRIWYEGALVVDERVDDPAPFLRATTASYQGEVLKAGEVHPSQPRKYSPSHPKAGQPMPGTGGNWTITHSGVIELADADGKPHSFTLMVTITYVAKKGFVVSVKAIPQAERKPKEPTLITSGLSFAGAAA